MASAMRFLATWNQVELIRTKIINALMETDVGLLCRVVSDLPHGVQNAFFMSTLHYGLPKYEATLIKSIWKTSVDHLREERNKYTHWLYGYSSYRGLRSALILVPPEAVALSNASWVESSSPLLWPRTYGSNEIIPRKPRRAPLQRDFADSAIVYSVEALNYNIMRVEKAHRVARGLLSIIRQFGEPSKGLAALLRELPDSRHVQTLARSREFGPPPPLPEEVHQH